MDRRLFAPAMERDADRNSRPDYQAANLPALVADHRRGLATYRRLGSDAELVTLDADPVGVGTGTAIIEALAVRLRAENCERLWLTTTNDKLSALRFYLRRGFRIIQVRLGAVEAARKLKPSIPMVGEYGISIQDELDLCRAIDARLRGIRLLSLRGVS